MDSDKFDVPLLGILQNCGELEPFLEVILGFLYRKTDFFRPLSSDQTMGFPPGVAKEKLLKVFKKYERMGSPATVPRSPPTTTNHPPTPPATPGLPSAAPRTIPPSSTTSTVSTAELAPQPDEMEEIQGDWTTSNWDHHNGGVTKNYAWSQSAQDVELKMALPNPNIKASDLKIDIKPYNLKVQLKQETGLQTLLEEKLHSLVKPEESMWSLHKENNPNVAVQIKEEPPTSPRWNQKFSSLVPRKKASPRDKPQRVRGPAIQWSAETLFNTADEAKAFITRDNKWKFRYSHQTTEGKKVYYQCTQRAKLGCGALCHVVYHHVGTALLYTNGEMHNHIEYNSILNSTPPPANVAISNINVQNQVALLQKIVSSASSNCTSLHPSSPKSSSFSRGPREDWTPVTIFQSPADAKTFIEHEGLWKFSYSHATQLGRKVFYDCTQRASEGCPAKVQLFYHAAESTVSYMINGAPHKHSNDSAVLVRKRGLSNSVKDAILEAYDNGFTDTKLVSKYLQIRGLQPPTASKIKVFLSKNRPDSYNNDAPISMLQWQFAPLSTDEESVMGEVVAKC